MIRKTIKIDGPPPRRPDQVHSPKGGPGIHARVEDTGEKYDCVIVGAGASGIAAAKYYRDRFGPNKRILIVDALPDFGGHSHRNEWHIRNAAAGNADVTILRNGGTVNLDSPGTWNTRSRVRRLTILTTRNASRKRPIRPPTSCHVWTTLTACSCAGRGSAVTSSSPGTMRGMCWMAPNAAP